MRNFSKGSIVTKVLITILLLGVIIYIANLARTALPMDKDVSYDKADSTGSYSQCLSLKGKEKQFCLWLAAGKKADIKICQLMDKDLYKPNDLYSQQTCFTRYAYATNNKAMCDNIPERSVCLSGFGIMEANRAICGPKDVSDTRWLDCKNGIYASHSVSKCDQLLPFGQEEVNSCKTFVKGGNYAGGYDPVANK